MKQKKEISLKEEAKRFLIIDAIAKGERFISIVQKFSKQWNLSPKTVELIISDAIDYMKSEKVKETLIAMNMERLDNIISDSMNDGDRRSAIKAIDTQNKLAGGYEEKIKVETDSEINLVFDIGES